MRAVDIIIKKRDQGELTLAEIEFFIKSFISGEVADYQASALLMAIVLNGMTPRETTDLTLAMANSGHMLDLSDVVDLAADKHSSGGVGDKTSLAVLPIVAACGLPVGKMSGRGLGFSGGTLDKLESIPGYRVDLTTEEFKHQHVRADVQTVLKKIFRTIILQRFHRFDHFQGIPHGISQGLVHIGEQRDNFTPSQLPDIHHHIGELTRILERLHERAQASLHVEQDRLRARRQFLAHNRRGNQRNRLYGPCHIAQGIQLSIGRSEIQGLPG